MAPRHVTARGKPIDMDRLRNMNGDKPAVGNASINARGDILGQGGVVLKTQEQIEAEWAAARARMQPKPMDLKTPDKVEAALARVAPQAKPNIVTDEGVFDAAAHAAANPRRKVIDKD